MSLNDDARAVLDPDVFTTGAPFEAMARLRSDAPAIQVDLPDMPPIWLLTRHEDVQAASRNSTTYSSEEGNTFIRMKVPANSAMLPSLDPPRHSHFRGLISKGFTPRNVAKLEDRIREIAVGIVENIIAAGEIEVVESLSAEISLQVIAEVLGVPQEDRLKIFRWSNALGSLGVEDPDYAPTPEAVGIAGMEMFGYCNELLASKEETPGDDIVSALLAAEVDGEKLTRGQLTEFFVLLAVAGNETTRNTMSHGLLALTEHPDQQRLLVADPNTIPAAVEEMVRWTTPVLHFRRTVAEPVTIHGQDLKVGDWALLHYLSANRDERAFNEPERFDVTRSPNPHVSFGGGGAHFCLGAQLARLELRIMFEELLKRAPDFTVTGEPTRLRSAFFHGIKRLPARV